MKKKKNKKPRVAFVVADNNNIPYFEKLKNSIRKFHDEKELPIALIAEEQIKATGDPSFFYRATPIVAMDLLLEYEAVIKLDADQVITGDISHVWKGDFDLGVVNNSNPRENKKYPVSVLNINTLSYMNCGFVVMKSRKFVEHWFNLCFSPHFECYQMREQDLMNILIYYCGAPYSDYKIKMLDEGPNWHGLISKGYWPQIELRGDDLVLPKNGEWPEKEDKTIKAIHWAGGNEPNKMNFKLSFKPEVVKRLEALCSA